MTTRRVLTWATDQAQALKRIEDYYGQRDPSVLAEQIKGRWAVTAAKTVKKEGR